jgi:16S rRNA U1498 N3-methylase RsmE
VLSVNKRDTRIHAEESRQEPAPGVELILAQALIKNTAFELVLEKAVEIGVTRIIPFRALRSNVPGGGEREAR